jgi:hypothetical protein
MSRVPKNIVLHRTGADMLDAVRQASRADLACGGWFLWSGREAGSHAFYSPFIKQTVRGVSVQGTTR